MEDLKTTLQEMEFYEFRDAVSRVLEIQLECMALMKAKINTLEALLEITLDRAEGKKEH